MKLRKRERRESRLRQRRKGTGGGRGCGWPHKAFETVRCAVRVSVRQMEALPDLWAEV